MTKRSFGWCLILLLLGASVMAQANCFWQEGDPYKMHYPQLPDTFGWDVNATYPVVLADDWQCSETGYIKDIHWWGSWRNGVQDVINSFVIKIYEDIPGDPAAGIYSHPGALLWERDIPGFDGIIYTSQSFEGWFDPTTGEILNNNHQQYFFYNYCLDQTDWFPQEQGTVYWLSISAVTASPNNAKWGWKSTMNHFNDDAVWALADNENWTELYEPGSGSAGPKINNFSISVDPSGTTTSATGTDFYGDGWYDYPSNWKNIWFYDHPFDPDRYKEAHIEFDAFVIDPGLPPTLELAINWSTDAWSIDQLPSDSAPPLPGEDEALYIGRQVLLSETTFGGHYSFDITLPDYNPEWVSIDVRGRNFNIQNGVIVHDCKGDPVSLDLAFVVTGDPNTPPTGACCFQDGTCSVVPEADCDASGGSYKGDGTSCQGDISPANGIDDACEDPPFGACCLPDGSCFVFNPTDCANKGGTYKGDGTSCAGDVSPANGIDDACEDPPFGACCLPDGTCLVFTETDCINRGGVYQGDGTSCLGDLDGDGVDDACEPQEGACCTQDGACAIMLENDCLAVGGTWHGAGSTCLGDNNGNGMDDACETWNPGDPHKMHFPQLPDTLGWDVNATFPEVLADDWQCSETGWVKDIHFWGSWLDGQPGIIAAFSVSIHEDIPAGTDGIPYSRPGKLLWEYTISDFNTTPLSHESFEGFYDPATQVFIPDNHQQYYQYRYIFEERPMVLAGSGNNLLAGHLSHPRRSGHS